MFDQDDREGGAIAGAAAAAAASEDAEYRRHASAKLVAFLDQVIEVIPAEGEVDSELGDVIPLCLINLSCRGARQGREGNPPSKRW